MKRKFMFLLLSTFICLASICLTGCGGGGINGTYYEVKGGDIDETCFMKIDSGKWSDDDGLGGTYKIEGNKIVLYVTMFGETEELMSGTIENNVLTFDFGDGVVQTYISKNHKHNYGELQNGRKETCGYDGYNYKECSCGYQEKYTIPKLSHNYGDWECSQTEHWKICSVGGEVCEEGLHVGTNECSICQYPITATQGLSYELNSAGDGYTVIGMGTATGKIIKIPEIYNELPVTAIGDSAFISKQIKYIFLSNTITSIGNSAFRYCDNLIKIEIPNSVVSIGEYAFERCSLLSEVVLPENLEAISPGMFEYCYNLKDITIPQKVKSIGYGAFTWCGFTSITIPYSVTNIHSTAFDGCIKLFEVYYLSALNINFESYFDAEVIHFSITEENRVKTTNDGLVYFTNNNNVTYLIDYKGKRADIVLPSKLDGNDYLIYQYAFYYNQNLTSVEIPDTVTDIGRCAFEFCSNLKNVVLPSGLKTLQSGTFGKCTSLKSIVLPDGLEIVGSSAFSECESLESIVFPGSLREVGDWSILVGCNKISKITFKAGAILNKSISHLPVVEGYYWWDSRGSILGYREIEPQEFTEDVEFFLKKR